MSAETQPTDRSDRQPLSPREVLRQTILNLATEPVDVEDDRQFAVIRRGYLRVPGIRFLVAEITAPTQHLSQDTRLLFPDHILQLFVYNTEGNGSVNSISMSGGTDGSVIGIIGERKFDNIDPSAEEKFIQDFFANNHLNDNGILLALGTPPPVTT